MKHKDWCKNYRRSPATGLCACVTVVAPEAPGRTYSSGGDIVREGDKVRITFSDRAIEGVITAIRVGSIVLGSPFDKTWAIVPTAHDGYGYEDFLLTLLEHRLPVIPDEPISAVARDRMGRDWWRESDGRWWTPKSTYPIAWRELWTISGPITVPTEWSPVK